MGRQLYVCKEPTKRRKREHHFKNQQSEYVDPFAQEHINFVEEIAMSEVSFSEPEQILSSGTEPELEPPAVHPAPPGADWVSSSSSEDVEARHIRLLETVSHPSELPHHAREALQALALIMEEEDQAREEAAGPVVRHNIPNLERPVFVRASNTDPKIMTPAAMLKATATNLTPPKLP